MGKNNDRIAELDEAIRLWTYPEGAAVSYYIQVAVTAMKAEREELSKMRILNLYGGLGGNRGGWGDTHEVVTVELDEKIATVYSENYPGDTVIIGDAHDYLLKHAGDFDFIWASPPCQSHSKMIRGGRNRKPRYPDLKLYEEILFLQYDFKGLWIVENVKPYYPPLVQPTVELGRHLIWSNFPISDFDPPKFDNFIKVDTVEKAEAMKKWLGINYQGSIYYGGNHCPCQVLRNCIHPAVGAHILSEVINQENRTV